MLAFCFIFACKGMIKELRVMCLCGLCAYRTVTRSVCNLDSFASGLAILGEADLHVSAPPEFCLEFQIQTKLRTQLRLPTLPVLGMKLCKMSIFSLVLNAYYKSLS